MSTPAADLHDGAGRDRSRSVIATVALAFIALVVATALLLVAHGRSAGLKGGDARVQRFMVSAAPALNRSLMAVDVLLGDMQEHLEPAIDGRTLDGGRASRLLEGLERRSLLVRDVAVVDASGRVVAAARAETLRLGSPIGPAALRAAFAPVGDQIVIGEPTESLVTRERSIHFARRFLIDTEPHVAIAEMPLASLASVLGPGADLAGLVVTVERTDGRLILASPAHDLDPARPLAALAPDALGGGVVRAPSRLDGRESLLLAQPAVYPSVVLTAGLPIDALLADGVGSSERLIGSVASAFVVLIAGVGWAAQLQLRRLARVRREVERGKSILDRALASMSDGFLLCDEHDRVVAWNPRYVEMFPWLAEIIRVGIPVETFASRAGDNLFPGADQTAERDAWKRRRREQRLAGNHESEIALPNGAVVQVTERRTPDGGVVGVYRDVTRVERELRAAKVAAESASLAKSQFLAAMSHEIRTPLNGVLGMNRQLLRSALDDDQRRCATTIKRSGEALLVLINDILDLSRVEAGQLELANADFAPRLLAQNVAGSLATRASEKGLALVVDAPPSLPTVLRGDEGRLRQVLFNLVGNAIKFTDTGTVSIEIDHRDLADGRVEIDFAVRDTGIGIDPANVPKLFQRFTQADGGIARRYGGSGLGLAICRELLELMGGRIALDSTPGRGSVFTASVPFHAGERVPAPPTDSAFDPPENLPGGLSVLAAEDNEVNQIVVRAMVEQLGHRCDIARDGAEAVDRVKTGRYDVVLMDVQMPNVDGIEATRRIRALSGRASRVPIIALTANAMVEERAAYLEVGMNDHVSKPIVARHLAQAIERMRGAAAETVV